MSNLTNKQKWILGTTIVVGGIALYIQTKKPIIPTRSNILYPPSQGSTPTGNRIFIAIREKSELQPLLITKQPLLLNFVNRGETSSNKLTGALQRIVSLETDKLVNMVDIEADEIGNRDLLIDYQVNKIPTIVALKNQLPRGSYCDEALIENPESQDVKWQELKAWVESHADEKKK
ncbi:unnamed protein product [[Candida] boidinii]|nr:unnamed protein product [[Candida] boidinii]